MMFVCLPPLQWVSIGTKCRFSEEDFHFILWAPVHLLTSSLLCSSTSVTMAEAITVLQMRKNSINHWVLHSSLIIVKKIQLVGGDSQVIFHPYTCCFMPFCHTDYVTRYQLSTCIVGCGYSTSTEKLTVGGLRCLCCNLQLQISTFVLKLTYLCLALQETQYV